jgi:predicted DNA-binding transcriptional regulator AlpA
MMQTDPILDRLLRTSEVARIEGVCTRTLAEKIAARKFPPPDVPAERRGAPDRWYESTIKRYREDRAQKLTQQPAA